MTANYADEDLDIACSAFDGFAYGIKAALLGAGYTEENWPLITGQDAEVMATKNIIDGTQTMSIYKDTRLLAEKAVTMVDAVLKAKSRKSTILSSMITENGSSDLYVHTGCSRSVQL